MKWLTSSVLVLQNLHLVLHVVSLPAYFCRLLMSYFVGISWPYIDAGYLSNCDVTFLLVESLLLIFVSILLLLISLF